MSAIGSDLGMDIKSTLSAAGISTSTPQQLRFYFYFAEAKKAEAISSALSADGFNCTVEQSDHEWMCLAEKQQEVDVFSLNALGNKFLKLSAELNGEFDGWELAI